MTKRNPGPSIWVTILAGGAGRRFWPLSTGARPKQLLALGGRDPLIVQALARVEGVASPGRLRVLTGAALKGPLQAATGLGDESFLLEPRPRGTGPALARAAWEAVRRDPGAVMVSVHADHLISPAGAFRDVLAAAVQVGERERLLMTVAIPPDRPETGFGYLRPGSPLPAPGSHRACRVDAFVEKPDERTASRYVDEGYRWNSGIFVWSAERFLEEVRKHAPEIERALPLLAAGDADGFFDAAGSISVDEAVLERSERVGAIDATFQWDDMGSWEALARHLAPDGDGNVVRGDVELARSGGNLAVAESGRVVLLGVNDLLVVQAGSATLVMPRSESAGLKAYLDALRADDHGGRDARRTASGDGRRRG